MCFALSISPGEKTAFALSYLDAMFLNVLALALDCTRFALMGTAMSSPPIRYEFAQGFCFVASVAAALYTLHAASPSQMSDAPGVLHLIGVAAACCAYRMTIRADNFALGNLRNERVHVDVIRHLCDAMFLLVSR
jgi:hypothetical protein